MKKSEEFALRKYCGDPDALCGIRDYVFNDGPARGMRAFDLNNGRGLAMTMLADRGLDIPYCTYKGINAALLNKVGLRSASLYREDAGAGFLKQFYGGLLTTGGLAYAGAAGEDGGRSLGLHGPFDNTPASKVCARAEYEGDDRVLRVTGEIRQSEVFAENLVLKRTLTLDTERDALHIRDVLENQGYLSAEAMLVYHVNFGYPLLDAGARVYANAAKVAPRTPFAAQGMALYDRMEAPEAGREEQCYYHTEPVGNEGFAMLHNERLGMAAVVRYDREAFPLLCEWKCMRAGDYALGLEPTTSGVVNRAEARQNGMLISLEPGEARAFRVDIEFTDDPEVVESYRARARRNEP